MQIDRGARVRLLQRLDKWSLLDVGSEGTVQSINEMPAKLGTRQIWIRWDMAGQTLALLDPQDSEKYEYWFPYNGKVEEGNKK